MNSRIFIAMALGAALLCSAPPARGQAVQVEPGIIQQTNHTRVTGTVERASDGRLWLKTLEGPSYLLESNLTYLDSMNVPISFWAIQPGTNIVAEFPASQVTVLGASPTSTTPAQVTVRYMDGTVVTRPIGEAVLLGAVTQSVVATPNTSLAHISTPRGEATINLMPNMVFPDGLTKYGTVQKKQDKDGTQEVYLLTSRGQQLAAPAQMIQRGEVSFGDLKIGDHVSMDVPDGTILRLTELFGDECQFKTKEGRLVQMPLEAIPEDVQDNTTVAVRRIGGEVVNMSLHQALDQRQSQALMLLIPGAPGVSYALGATGIYEVHIVERP